MPPDNAQQTKGRIRPPAVYITYDAEVEPLAEVVELPFVIGVLADLAAQSSPALPPLAGRSFVQAEYAGFDALVAAYAPRLEFEVGNRLEGGGAPLKVELSFRSLSEFDPEGVARQVPGLLEALAARRPEASARLDAILHAPAFQRLESSWRSLRYLLGSIETSASLKVRVLHATKEELLSDFRGAPEPSRSTVFQKVHDEPYGTFRGEPFAVLLGDYEFSNSPDDLDLLEGMAKVAAAAHAPFIAAPSPEMFGLPSFPALGETRRVPKIFEGEDWARWRAFRQTAEAGYAALVLPRILLRLPYGDATVPVQAFSYQENLDEEGCGGLLWGNAAFALAVRLADAFRVYHWCAAIEGPEGGGLVTDLPTHTLIDLQRGPVMKGPLELSLDDIQEKELVDCGFNCLLHCKGTDMAAFFAVTTCRQPPEPNAAATLATRLPHVLAASRFVHCMKAMLRDRFEAPGSREECERVLNDWIGQYVVESDSAPFEIQVRYPLRYARVEVDDVPGSPGRFRATASLRPCFQLRDGGVPVRIGMDLPLPVR